MAKLAQVIATARGHDGLVVREPGEEFSVPESVFTAKKDDKGGFVQPSWFKRKGAATAAGKPAEAPAGDDLA